jgi:hypothetical protein
MIPRESIDVFRNFVDVSLDNYGIDCDLYVPTNIEDMQPLDIYREPIDYEYDHYTAKVFIQWHPSVYRLKNLGIYVEGELPIIVFLPNQCLSDDEDSEGNIEVDVDILKGSYIKIPLEYVPSNQQKNTEFELVDLIARNMHDAVLVKAWKAVPRRVIVPENREVND